MVICGLSGSTIYVINGKIWKKKLLNIKYVFWFPPQILSETFSFEEECSNQMYIHIKCPSNRYSCHFNETCIFSIDFWKILIKFHENPSSGSRVLNGQRYKANGHFAILRPHQNFSNAENGSHVPLPNILKLHLYLLYVTQPQESGYRRSSSGGPHCSKCSLAAGYRDT